MNLQVVVEADKCLGLQGVDSSLAIFSVFRAKGVDVFDDMCRACGVRGSEVEVISSIEMEAGLSMYLPTNLSTYLSIHPSIYRSIYLSGLL